MKNKTKNNTNLINSTDANVSTDLENINETNYKKRSIGINSIVPFNEQINPKIASSFPLDDDDYPNFTTTPHTFLSMIICMFVIFSFAFYNPIYLQNKTVLSGVFSTLEQEENFLMTIGYFLKIILVVIIIFGITHVPDSVMRRPHPLFWRCVFSVGFFYFIALLFLVSFNVNDARFIMKTFDPNLGKKLSYKSYGEGCSLKNEKFPYFTLQPIWEAFDMYIVAHLLGWFVKYLAIRNVKMSLFLSFLFEMMEITFSNWLPNFIECWWDQVILDFLGMNMLGMILGYILVDYFKMKNYGWLETKNKPKMPEYCSKLSRVSIKGEKKRSACDEITNTSTDKTKNLIKYFTPNEVIIYEWDVFSSSWRFFTVLWFVATCILCDLSHFFLKTVLWLPITHWVLAFRIFLWGFMCIIASREFYEYITNPVCKALGHFIWLTQLILFTEWMIIIKFREDLFTAPFDEKVIYCWTATIIVLIIIAVKLIIQDFIKLLKSGPSEKIDRNVIDVEYH